jgi:CheY-like chemotaxis protein
VIRVFLVDDHHFFLSGLRAELGAEFEIVGEAGEVDAAVDGIRRTRPDVVLLDVHLPGGGGRAVLEAVRQTDQEIRFLALSVSDAAEPGPAGTSPRRSPRPTWPPPSAGSRAATPCSPPAWPGSCSTPSTAT